MGTGATHQDSKETCQNTDKDPATKALGARPGVIPYLFPNGNETRF